MELIQENYHQTTNDLNRENDSISIFLNYMFQIEIDLFHRELKKNLEIDEIS